MQLLYLSAGSVLLLLATSDALVTTVTLGFGRRPISAFLGARLWRLVKRVASGPRSRLLAAAGPVILLASVVAWVLLLWAGWTLVFSADPAAVRDSQSGAAAGVWARVYFVGYTLFTLGNGDYRPAAGVWQVATPLAALHGLAVITLSITYLVPVVTAIVARRQQAVTIAALGPSAEAIVVGAWDGHGFSFLDRNLPALSTALMMTAQRHLAYPVLHYFHSPDRHSAFPRSVAALDEALNLLEHGIQPQRRPHPATLRSCRQATVELLKILDGNYIRPAEQPPAAPDLEVLRRAGLPVVTAADFRAGIEPLGEHRRALLAFVQDGRWDWPAGPADVDR